MLYYPLFLRLQGEKCVVVGGGVVAERKVRTLLECGASVLVISARLSQGLRRLVDNEKLLVIERSYRQGDLEGARVAIAATNSSGVNTSVASEARHRGILVNVVDDPEQSDFILPSVLRRGELVVTVSTGGESPALAKKVRTELEKAFVPEHAQLVTLVSEVRQEMQLQGKKANASTWQRSLNLDRLLGMLRKGNFAQAKEELMKSLRQETQLSRGSS